MADRTASVVPPLGDLCTVMLDPEWPHAEAFLAQNPIGRKLSFAFIDLEQGISEASPPNYADTEVVGRAEQYKTWVGTANREYSIMFRFHVQGLPQNLTAEAGAVAALQVASQIGGGPSGAAAAALMMQNQLANVLLREVVDPAMWLDALKQSVVDEAGITHAPPPVLLTIGRLVPTCRVLLTSGEPVWQPPFDPDTMLPHAAEFAATFTVVRRNIKSNLFAHRRQYR